MRPPCSAAERPPVWPLVALATLVLLLAGPAASIRSVPEPGGEAHAAPVPAATIVGTWRWHDADEALTSARNPSVVRIVRTSQGLRATVAGRPAARVAWQPRTGAFSVVLRRWVGLRGATSASVTYRGQVVRADAGWRMSGLLRIAAASLPGKSAFSARRMSPRAG